MSLIIIATGPFLAAALAWVWLRGDPRLRTMLASAAALCGVAIIVGGARAGSDILGIGLACLMALAIAAMTVMVRRHKDTPMVAAAAMSNILGSVGQHSLRPGHSGGHRDRPNDPGDVRVLQVALGLTLFFLGSRLLPSGQAALISTLETPLMPSGSGWRLARIPRLRVLAGGALVMGAVIADIIGDSRTRSSRPVQLRFTRRRESRH